MKKAALIVIILGVAVVGLAIKLVTDSANTTPSVNTENWSTYSNPQYNYSIKHPTNLSALEIGGYAGQFDGKEVIFTSDNLSGVAPKAYYIGIHAVDDKDIAAYASSDTTNPYNLNQQQ